MSFSDIIKKSVLESFSTADMSAKYVSVVLIETFLIALYIFMVYRFITRSSFYNKNYAISMAIISEITAGIILAMQSNLVISLGMVGALSIVRFRTAIKEPMDLLFLFWSIGTGIICGAGLFSLGVLIAVFVTIGIVLLNLVPAFSAPQLLILKLNDSAAEKQAIDVVKKNASSFKVDSKSATSSAVTLIIEVKTKSGSDMVNELVGLGSVISATLMEHEGEVKN
ncbi:DUF4956 domain-containing protein [Pseudobutyrivibrio ruminis]|uniref:DUF4956 domain-containing protein n=1 Tax=Pseudobutyrivibrio ruminis TaxID=46206 RepID=A0A2G3DX36_9FIRM|nr:DUF4956 domain-containing protein [Pseudobutyrivibrio ruminis]PHU35511.1 DUF4956 domain-containing protein [Pseudobutyrivibrio ruminis]